MSGSKSAGELVDGAVKKAAQKGGSAAKYSGATATGWRPSAKLIKLWSLGMPALYGQRWAKTKGDVHSTTARAWDGLISRYSDDMLSAALVSVAESAAKHPPDLPEFAEHLRRVVPAVLGMPSARDAYWRIVRGEWTHPVYYAAAQAYGGVSQLRQVSEHGYARWERCYSDFLARYASGNLTESDTRNMHRASQERQMLSDSRYDKRSIKAHGMSDVDADKLIESILD